MAEFKQKNVYQDNFFWLWYNIHIMHYQRLHKFLQAIKCCCQVLVQATSLSKKVSIGMLLGYGYMRNNLVHLRGYPTRRGVADMSNLYYCYCAFIWSRAMTPLPRSGLSKRNGMNNNQYIHFRQPVETKIIQMRFYQFKLTKNLFLSRGYEHVSILNMCLVWWDGADFILYTLSLTAYRDIFSI